MRKKRVATMLATAMILSSTVGVTGCRQAKKILIIDMDSNINLANIFCRIASIRHAICGV